jgi:hypothetical protein
MAMVPKKFTAKMTQTTVMAMSMGQISSAYSFDWVIPSGSVMAAATMMPCQPQKCSLDRRSEYIRTFSKRCIE